MKGIGFSPATEERLIIALLLSLFKKRGII
jgi:hypothetical protein